MSGSPGRCHLNDEACDIGRQAHLNKNRLHLLARQLDIFKIRLFDGRTDHRSHLIHNAQVMLAQQFTRLLTAEIERHQQIGRLTLPISRVVIMGNFRSPRTGPASLAHGMDRCGLGQRVLHEVPCTQV